MLPADMLPTGSDISMQCKPSLIAGSGNYSISITIELNETFTPAVLEGIAALELSRSRDGLFPFEVFTPIKNVSNQTTFFDTVIPLLDGFYDYVVSQKVDGVTRETDIGGMRGKKVSYGGGKREERPNNGGGGGGGGGVRAKGIS